MDIDKKIKEMEASTSYRAQFIREPINQHSTGPNTEEWQKLAHEWLIHFSEGASVSYFTGLAHRKPKGAFGCKKEYEYLVHKNLTPHGFKKLLRLSVATPPDLKDVLYSLSTDASAAQENFKDWCANYEYDDDSMEAMGIYKECIENAGLLRGLGFDLEELQEYFQDY